MKELIKKNWKNILLILQGGAIVFFAGRGFESRFVGNLASEAQSLANFKYQVEQTVNAQGTPALKQAFKQLGFNVTVAQEISDVKK